MVDEASGVSTDEDELVVDVVDVVGSEELDVVDVVEVVDVVGSGSGVVMTSSDVVEVAVGTGASVVAAGGGITLREIVAPHSERGVSLGQHPASVQ